MSSASLVQAELFHKGQTSLIFCSALFGAILLDLVVCLPTEIKYIYFPDFKALVLKQKRPPLPSILLFNSRILTIPLLTLTYISFVGQVDNCSALWRAILLFYSFAAVNAVAIFIVRVIAIRNSGKALITFLVILLCGHASILIYWLMQAKAIQVPITSKYSASCQGVILTKWTWKLVSGFACMDLVLLFLTIYESEDFKKVMERLKMIWKGFKTQNFTIAQRFYIDSIILFTVQISFIFTEVGWLKTHSNDPIYNLLPAPIHILMSLTLAPRTIRSLKLFYAKKMSHRKSLQISDPNQIFDDVAGRVSNIAEDIRISQESPAFEEKNLPETTMDYDDSPFVFGATAPTDTSNEVQIMKKVFPSSRKRIRGLLPLLPLNHKSPTFNDPHE